MRKTRVCVVLATAVAGGMFFVGGPIARTQGQAVTRIESSQLKMVISNLGYETKDLNTEAGKEKVEFSISKGGLNIPIAVEVSPSKNFIWLSVLLSSKTPEGDKAIALLKQNAQIQPSQFYVTSSGLRLAFAVENRNTSPVWLRAMIEKLADDVVSTKAVWGD